MEELVKLIITNSEKIGIGVVCLVVAFALVYALRILSRYMEKDQDKDAKMMEFNAKSIDAVAAVRETADKMNSLATAVVESHTSSKQSNNSLSLLMQTVDSSIKKLTGDILSKLDNNQIAILNAINSRDLSSLQKGVIVVNPSGRIISVNQDALDILELPSNEILNTTLKDRSNWFIFADGSPVPPDEIPSVFALTTALPSRHNVLGFMKPPNTTIKWLLVDADPTLSTEERRVTRVVVTIRDVGEFIVSKTDTLELPAINA